MIRMKKTNIIISAFAMALCLAGCGVKVDDMTDAEAELVTEYATQILLKHSSTSTKNLLNDEKMKAEEAKEAEIRERNKKMQEAKEAYLNSEGKEEKKEDAADSSTDSKTEVVEKEYIDNAAELMKAENFNLTYRDYKLCQSYPEEKRDDDFLSVDAKEGKQLLVLNFEAVNQLAEDTNLDLFSKGGRFFLSINGEPVIESSPTILMDDLSMFKDTVSASATKDLVLLFEVAADTKVNSLELSIKCGDEKGYMKLQ